MKKTMLSMAAIAAIVIPAMAAGDLDMMGLKGNVAQVITEIVADEDGFGYADTLTFDAGGRLNGVNGQKPAVTHGTAGRMTKVVLKETDEEGEPIDYTVRFSVGADGRISVVNHSQEWGDWKDNLKWDASGRLVSKKSVDPLNPPVVYRYSYTAGAVDDHGNWTERTVTSDGVTQRERRTITYWSN